MKFREASKIDLESVCLWITSTQDCLVWAGPRVRFPLIVEQLIEDLDFNSKECFVLDDDNKILAFGQIRIFEQDRMHLSRIIVNPTVRSQGIGKIFVKKLVYKAKELKGRTISLNVMNDNQIAINMYTELGFVPKIPQPEDLRAGITRMELKGTLY